MGNLKIIPGKLHGNVRVPPSKSVAHRAIFCAALAEGTTILKNVDLSDDILATLQGMQALGAQIQNMPDCLGITGIGGEKGVCSLQRTVDCSESGSTLRFMIPIALLYPGETRFIGKGNLGKRPLEPYYEIFDRQGIKYRAADEKLDLTISGSLQPGEYSIRGDVSSQFITGLLLSLPLLGGDSTIRITGQVESKGYLDLTLSVLSDFGVNILRTSDNEYFIKGNQYYQNREYFVEGDYSQAAFFLAAGALGSDVCVSGLKEDSLQADRVIVDILKKMGVSVAKTGNGLSAQANKLSGTVIDGRQCPDIIPILAAVAALSEGETRVVKAGRLRIKECDRLRAIATELNKLGAQIKEEPEGLLIQGVKQLGGGSVCSHNDHRIAMTLAIAATRCTGPVFLSDYQCVSKSYPKFFEDYKFIGGTADEWNMGQ